MTKSNQLGGVRAWFSWILSVSFVVMVFALQTGYAITNVHVADSLSLTLTQVGIVGSIYTWVFAISQFSSGAILDKFGTRILPFACALVAVGAFVFANSDNIYTLLLAQVLTAIGASYGFIGAGFVGGVWFEPVKYGLMFALVQFVASTSAVLNQQILNSLIAQVSWSTLINVIALISAIIAVLLYMFVKDPEEVAELRKKENPWRGFKSFVSEVVNAISKVASISDAWINCLIGGAMFGSMLALGVVWGPRILVEGGMSQSDANVATSMSWFGLAIGAPLFAWISDRMQSRKKPMLIACALQLFILVFAMVLPGVTFISGSTLMFLWGVMAGGSMIPFSIAADLVEKSLIGTSAALVNATQFIIGGILMAIPGRILAGEGLVARVMLEVSDKSSSSANEYLWAVSVYPIALFLALILFLFLRETYPKSVE